MEVMIRELFLFYNSYIKGELNPLPPLRIQYKDYASWQQQQLNSGVLSQDKEYWLNRLSGELPVLSLMGDKVRPLVKTYNGGVVRRTLSRASSEGLKSLVQAEGSTFFMGLLAAVSTLLYRYTEQTDIILGSPAAL